MEHRVPALWAMHSLHHSDDEMNILSSYRHFWLLKAIGIVMISFPVGLLFKANAAVLISWSFLSIVVLFSHMNIPVGLGRGWFLLNSPQFHRIHHSSLHEHMDKNFANLFPIWDVIFGTAHRPAAGEFPPTGLYDGDIPRSVIETILWPLRGVTRRHAPKTSLEVQDTKEARVLLVAPTARG
jgi:sterol desaturase/sphingolipid hydroxylase (fatty acid hydroxylase superfamily)